MSYNYIGINRNDISSECNPLVRRVMLAVQKQIVPSLMGPQSIELIRGGLFNFRSRIHTVVQWPLHDAVNF